MNTLVIYTVGYNYDGDSGLVQHCWRMTGEELQHFLDGAQNNVKPRVRLDWKTIDKRDDSFKCEQVLHAGKMEYDRCRRWESWPTFVKL